MGKPPQVGPVSEAADLLAKLIISEDPASFPNYNLTTPFEKTAMHGNWRLFKDHVLEAARVIGIDMAVERALKRMGVDPELPYPPRED